VSLITATYANNGYRALDPGCPKCGQEVRVDLVGDRLNYSCRAGCGPAVVAAGVDEDKVRDHLRGLRDRSNGAAEDTAAQVARLYGLDRVGLEVTGSRVVGSGGSATVYLYLSDGRELVFERLRDMAKPQTVLVELAARTGARPKLDQAKCIDAIALIRELADHELTASIDEISREWGVTFRQSAQVIDVDMDYQAQRWAAFVEHIHGREPASIARNEPGTSVAHASVVLRHVDGTRFVRAGWFRAHVRTDDVTASPQEIAQRMERVGWRRPGAEGRVKATCPGPTRPPGLPDTLVWRFYVVAADWDQVTG
jgi:hypothetical protein